MYIKSLVEIKDHLIQNEQIIRVYGYLKNGGALIKSPKTNRLIHLNKNQFIQYP